MSRIVRSNRQKKSRSLQKHVRGADCTAIGQCGWRSVRQSLRVFVVLRMCRLAQQSAPLAAIVRFGFMSRPPTRFRLCACSKYVVCNAQAVHSLCRSNCAHASSLQEHVRGADQSPTVFSDRRTYADDRRRSPYSRHHGHISAAHLDATHNMDIYNICFEWLRARFLFACCGHRR